MVIIRDGKIVDMKKRISKQNIVFTNLSATFHLKKKVHHSCDVGIAIHCNVLQLSSLYLGYSDFSSYSPVLQLVIYAVVICSKVKVSF